MTTPKSTRALYLGNFEQWKIMDANVKDPLDFIRSNDLATNGRPISENFEKWFGSSAVRDKNGDPIIVYHGTSVEFTTFDPKKGAQGVIWVTSNKTAVEDGEIGADSSGIIMDLFASIRNPASWDEYDRLSIDEIESAGYDGVILPNDDGNFEAIVFESRQLKSASKNSGLFIFTSGDITDGNDAPSLKKKRRP